MYVEASQGNSWDLARFESTWLQQSASTCVVSFWYHMYGNGIGTLYGYIKVGQIYTRLFEEWGNKGMECKTRFALIHLCSMLPQNCIVEKKDSLKL